MPRSVIGPLALEAPLGSNPKRTSVYRAIHVQQKKQVAIRVFPIPLGLTPEGKQHFAEQMEELKLLRHSNIVRCFGGGFDKKEAYLAYELIDGESLDQTLARRGKLPWETAMDYGLQLASALQYASERGWTHGRLRPDKIILAQGGLSALLSDYRRDQVALWMDSAPPSLEQMRFRAPELFDGGTPNEKADLYALGAVLYLMLTGQPPFTGKTIDEYQKQARSSIPQAPASIALDCPVWLSTIVCQLLERDQAKRPFSAAAVSMALQQARERTLEGKSVAEHVVSGFNPLQIKGDRKEAEKLLGRKETKPLEERLSWLLNGTTGLVALLIISIAAITWMMMPLSEATLRSRAEQILADEAAGQWNRARDEYLLPLIERFPDSPNAAWARERVDEIEMRNLEKRIESAIRFGRELKTEGERRYVEAERFERFGDRVTALDKYQAIITMFSDSEEDRPIVNLARRQIDRIHKEPIDNNAQREFLQARLTAADEAYRDGKTIDAKKIWDSIISLYEGNQESQPFVDQARQRLKELKE